MNSVHAEPKMYRPERPPRLDDTQTLGKSGGNYQSPWMNGLYFLSGVTQEDGRLIAPALVIGRDVYYQSESGERTAIGYSVGHHNLRESDILPIFGGLYFVANLDESANRVKFKQLSDKELSARLGVSYHSLILPAKGNLYAYMGHMRILAFETVRGPDGKMEDVVRVENQPREKPKEKLSLKVGDKLPLMHLDYEVRRIVPPHEKEQITGWVEFHPTFLDSEEPLGPDERGFIPKKRPPAKK